MHSVKTELSFAAAHRLPGHKGRCRFIHGHNYRVVLTLQAPSLQEGMVIDFSRVKEIAKTHLDAGYDHKLILWSEDPIVDSILASLPGEMQREVILYPEIPTAENMAWTIYDNLVSAFDAEYVTLSRVEVFETPNSSASYPGEV